MIERKKTAEPGRCPGENLCADPIACTSPHLGQSNIRVTPVYPHCAADVEELFERAAPKVKM
ncbi:MAG TPA: hypothetical protein VGJ66_14750 [Pyrinomonadaceae bacterium]|jgi:hypothetical protein